MISGGYAQREDSSLTWTVDDWGWALEKYTEDCTQLKVIDQSLKADRKIRPNKTNLPLPNERLSLEPDIEKIRVIHVGAYFRNKEMLLGVLRLVLSIFRDFSISILNDIIICLYRKFECVIFKLPEIKMYGEGPILMSLEKVSQAEILPQLRNDLKTSGLR